MMEMKKLAHHILAQDVPAVDQWYQNEMQHPSPILPLPLFHFGPYSNVPLIYFAIQYQNIELIRLLLSKGHRITTRISHEDLVATSLPCHYYRKYIH